MTKFSVLRRRALSAAALAVLPASIARAQAVGSAATFPSRPMKMLIGSPPGGPSDFLARMLADAYGPQFAHPLVLEHKPGASGTIAAELAAKAAPDGHTLLASGPASIAVAPHLFAKINYDPMKDLTPINILGAGAFVLVAHPSLAVSNVAELVAYAKRNAGSIPYASGGNGSSGHLCTEAFCRAAGIAMTHVPYKGDGQAVVDLVSGQVKLFFTAPNVGVPHAKAGRLKLLAVTSRERVASMAETPTVAESGATGLTDFEYLGWILTFAPAGTPPAVVDALAAAWNKVRNTPAVKGRLDELAMVAPERLAERSAVQAFVRSEHARLGKLIRDVGLHGTV